MLAETQFLSCCALFHVFQMLLQAGVERLRLRMFREQAQEVGNILQLINENVSTRLLICPRDAYWLNVTTMNSLY
jgi:hypothetical protein